MGAAKGAVEIADRRGNDGHLRVSWHPEKRVVNVSQWRRGICVSTTPVELSDLPALVQLLVGALEEATRTAPAAEYPPEGPQDGVGSAGQRFPGRRLLRSARRRLRSDPRALRSDPRALRSDPRALRSDQHAQRSERQAPGVGGRRIAAPDLAQVIEIKTRRESSDP